jgi:energy-converting hydrogenase Eha subunit A
MTADSESNPRIENQAVRKLVLYVLGVILVSTFLLTINTGMIFSLATGLLLLAPDLPMVPQLGQLFIFVCPILLLYLEWYVWDVVSARRIRSRASEDQSS